MNRKILVLILLGLGLLVYSGLRNKKSVLPPISAVEKKETYKVIECQVIESHLFKLTLSDGRIILGQLRVRCPKESERKIVEFLHQVSHPEVILLKKEEGYWLIELNVKLEGKRILLSQWLLDQRLAFN